MQTQIAIAIRLEDPDAEPETVTLTTTEPAQLAPGEADAILDGIINRLKPEFEQDVRVARMGHLARFVALNRELGVLPHHDTNPKGRITPFWTWCACGQTHRLEHDCPRCGPQKPETD